MKSFIVLFRTELTCITRSSLTGRLAVASCQCTMLKIIYPLILSTFIEKNTFCLERYFLLVLEIIYPRVVEFSNSFAEIIMTIFQELIKILTAESVIFANYVSVNNCILQYDLGFHFLKDSMFYWFLKEIGKNNSSKLWFFSKCTLKKNEKSHKYR